MGAPITVGLVLVGLQFQSFSRTFGSAFLSQFKEGRILGRKWVSPELLTRAVKGVCLLLRGLEGGRWS